MCTVTFIPVKHGVILTSNRDEHMSRGAALPPEIELQEHTTLAYPKDTKAGGTWFIADDKGHAAVLLNGADENHIPQASYKKSRGIVLCELFTSGSPFGTLMNYDFTGVENFTIILWEHKILREIKWNGESLNIIEQDATLPHIWSSVTLYSNAMIKERHGWFKDWLKADHHFTQADCIAFHSHTNTGNKEYGLLICRNTQMHTSSITSLLIENDGAKFYHHDCINQTKSNLDFALPADKKNNSSSKHRIDAI